MPPLRLKDGQKEQKMSPSRMHGQRRWGGGGRVIHECVMRSLD